MSGSRSRALLLEGLAPDGGQTHERSPLHAALAAEGIVVTRAGLTAPAESWGFAPDLILLSLEPDAQSVAEATARLLLNDERFDDVPILLLVPAGSDYRGGGDALLADPTHTSGAMVSDREADATPTIDADRVSRLLAEGAFDYVTPSFSVPVLRSRIQAALRWRKRLRAATETPSARNTTSNGLPSLPPVPLTQRALRVSGAVVRGSRRTGASFDVALDEFGRLTLFAFDAGWSEEDAPMKSFAVRRAVREALDLGRPLDQVAADAAATLRSLGSDSLGLVALRFSADATTLEVLDCGFAPVYELEANGTLVPFAPPSARLGLSDMNRFSASMLSVRSGSLYIAMSRPTNPPGESGAPLSDATLRSVLSTVPGEKGPIVLASMSEPELRTAWRAALPSDPEDDVVVLVAANDPSHVSLRP